MDDEKEKELLIRENQSKNQIQQMMMKDQVVIPSDFLNLSLSFLLIYAFIHSTYDGSPFQNPTWGVFNTLIRIMLLLEWMIKVYFSKTPLYYLYSQESLIAIISLIPFFIIRIATFKMFVEDDDPYTVLGDLFCLIRSLEFCKLSRYMDSEVNKQLLVIIVQITSLVISAAGALYFNSLLGDQVFNFQYYIYFVMTILSTLGYENKFTSISSRVMIIILIIFALTFVPIQTGELIRHLSGKSYYARLSYKASETVPHIVILGSLTSTSAETFFNELFNEDHGMQQRHAVILSPHLPDPNLESLIRSPAYQNVKYIQGDPHLDKDLKRCSLEKAKSIIIMSNKQSVDAASEDSKTILLAIVIKNYLKQYDECLRYIKFCMQILRQEGKTHYYLSLNQQMFQDQVICIEELKMSLLAKACLCPGLIALISNLIQSSGNPSTPIEQEWLKEYWDGQGFEIYKTSLPNFFRGKSFSQSVLILYKKFQVILFGLEIQSLDEPKIYLNPGDMVIPTQTNWKIMGYIISQDKEAADEIANYRNGVTKQATNKLEMQDTSNSKRRKPISETISNFLGFGSKSSNMPKKKRVKKNTIILKSSAVNGWIKMKSYNPSTDTNMPTYKAEDDQMIDEDEEDREELQQEIMRRKIGQDTYRNQLQLDFNKIKQRCIINNEKINLKDVTFKTMANFIIAQNHVILCGVVPNLINFVMPLRSKYLDQILPIVILNDQEPSEKLWNQISLFPEIYFVKGSAMNQNDLIRANLKAASRVVILSTRVEEVLKAKFDEEDANQDQPEGDVQQRYLTKDQEDLLDTRTIFKYRNVIKLKPQVQIVTEFVSPQNLQFLLYDKDYALMKQYGYNHTPIFASGQIYLSSIMDSLLCQSYYNPALVSVIEQLLVGNTNNAQQEQTAIYKLSQQNQDQFSDVVPSNLFQMQVPTAFVGKTFDKLFYYLVKARQVVPLGLYRLPGSSDNKYPYVSTNPKPSTLLNQKDIVLILSQEAPNKDSINWGGPLEERKQAQVKTFNVYRKQTTTSSDEQDIIFMNEDNDKEVQKAKIFNNQSEEVVKRIQNTIKELAKIKDDVVELQLEMAQRQDKIIAKMKDVFQEELNNIIQKKENSQNQTVKSSED